MKIQVKIFKDILVNEDNINYFCENNTILGMENKVVDGNIITIITYTNDELPMLKTDMNGNIIE